MKIETKFNIGDAVYFINKNKYVDNGVVVKIDISVSRRFLAFGNAPQVTIKYVVDGELVEETRCFKTREELIKSL